MPNDSEKARRKQLLQSQREEARRAVRDSLPVPASLMKALFDHIDSRLSEAECDDTLRYAREFIVTNKLEEDPVVGWLENHGGYCDCEAINNTEEVVEDAVQGYRDLPKPSF